MSAWLAHDPELLRAALEIVDTWDEPESVESPIWTGSNDSGVDDSECASSTSAHSHSSSRSPPLPPLIVKPSHVEASRPRQVRPSTLRSTHRRRREEIEHLRTKLVELEQELLMLERRKRARRETAEPSMKSDHLHTSLWRDIAIRQQRLRNVSESEQVKLRVRIDAQKKVARGLLKLMQQSRKLEDGAMTQAVKRQRLISTDVELVDDINEFISIDEMHMNMDMAFAGTSLHDGLDKSTRIEVLEDLPGQFAIHLATAWTVPFSQHQVMNALWQFNSKRHSAKWSSPDFIDAHVRVDDDELVSLFTAVATMGSATGYFIGRDIVKRFRGVGTTPPTIITKLICTPSTTSPGDFATLKNREESCIRVLSMFPSGNSVGSRVQFCQKFTIAFTDDANGRHQAGVVTNIVLHKLRNGIDTMHETVETLLLSPPA